MLWSLLSITVLLNANVIDTDGERRNMTIVIEDGVIDAVGSAIELPKDATRIDLSGRYVLPGLIDAHNHVSGSREARRALESGVTTMRVMGTSHFRDVGMRSLRERGAIASPETFASGYFVGPGPSHGPGDEPPEALFFDAPELYDLKDGIHGAEAYRRVTAFNIARDVDWIKVTATARAGRPDTDPREQLMNLAELESVVAEAERAGLGVAAHAHGDEGGRAAVDAGVKSIEHGTYLSGETLDAMKASGVFLVPTIAVVRDLTEPGGNYDHPFLQVRGRHMLPRIQEVVRMALRRDLKIVTGTDTDYGASNTITVQHEMEELTRCGLTPLQAIRAATSTPAELLGIGDRTGAVRAGLEADLIAVERNPLENITALSDVLLVVSDGEVIINRLDFTKSHNSQYR